LWQNSSVQNFLKRLLDGKGEKVEFVVLFGSRAKGTWTQHSDYDVFIGLREDDGKRFIDRICEFSSLAEGPVEVFPYALSEWRRMFEGRGTLLLEVLEHGVVLFDRGSFARMREIFREWRERGEVVPFECGWHIKNF
jgi:predicted nucleotidyltransferase